MCDGVGRLALLMARLSWHSGDRFSRKKTPVEYEEDTGPSERWAARPGNRERLENLIWARDHCAGEFRVVMAIAKDTSADPREIRDCFPKEDLYMRITYLNPASFVDFKQSIARTHNCAGERLNVAM
jgi:hypothetical protein